MSEVSAYLHAEDAAAAVVVASDGGVPDAETPETERRRLMIRKFRSCDSVRLMLLRNWNQASYPHSFHFCLQIETRKPLHAEIALTSGSSSIRLKACLLNAPKEHPPDL